MCGKLPIPLDKTIITVTLKSSVVFWDMHFLISTLQTSHTLTLMDSVELGVTDEQPGPRWQLIVNQKDRGTRTTSIRMPWAWVPISMHGAAGENGAESVTTAGADGISLQTKWHKCPSADLSAMPAGSNSALAYFQPHYLLLLQQNACSSCFPRPALLGLSLGILLLVRLSSYQSLR